VLYAHATLGSPTVSTLTAALEKGFLPNVPGLTKASICQCPPHPLATVKGHLDQTQKHKQSTKTVQPSPFLQLAPAADDNPLNDAFPAAEPSGRADASTGKIFSDLAGRLPVTSSQGNNYIFLLYDYDSNTINVQAIPSPTTS
jgi:hypothetical protein